MVKIWNFQSIFAVLTFILALSLFEKIDIFKNTLGAGWFCSGWAKINTGHSLQNLHTLVFTCLHHKITKRRFLIGKKYLVFIFYCPAFLLFVVLVYVMYCILWFNSVIFKNSNCIEWNLFVFFVFSPCFCAVR